MNESYVPYRATAIIEGSIAIRRVRRPVLRDEVVRAAVIVVAPH
ncbi:MAG TPA: hypothetical protein VFY90_13445 [Tepidiformaceae bacterium]|nr:hypothetical protein [Tepidiformaceae bacterium]